MPLGSFPRAAVLRGVTVFVITATVWSAAACSDEDVVDTIPPPRPNRTTTSVGTTGTAEFTTTSTSTISTRTTSTSRKSTTP